MEFDLMTAGKRLREKSGVKGKSLREIWLLGQPPLQKLVDFLEEMTEPGEKSDLKPIIDEWLVANDHYFKMETSEAGHADGIELKPLPPSMKKLVRRVRSDAGFKRTFNDVPAKFVMLELAKLVVPQPHINLDHAINLKARVAKITDDEGLFNFCQPLDRQEPDIHVRRLDDSRYMFWSLSSDFRFHEATILKEQDVRGYDPIGPIGSILGLSVGYGSNFLNAIESDGRAILHNGHHRAYALLEHGFTHVPCIVQKVSRRDELDLVAPRAVRDAPAFYFKGPRPPLLKDFLDPRFRKVMNIPPIARVVEISFKVKEYEIKDFGAGR